MLTNEEEKRLTAVEERAKSNTHQLEAVKERQNNLDALVASVATMANEQEHIKEDVAETKADVKTLIGKPGARWEGIVDKLIWLVVGGAVTYLLSQIF